VACFLYGLKSALGSAFAMQGNAIARTPTGDRISMLRRIRESLVNIAHIRKIDEAGASTFKLSTATPFDRASLNWATRVFKTGRARGAFWAFFLGVFVERPSRLGTRRVFICSLYAGVPIRIDFLSHERSDSAELAEIRR
jgi:hypothetical protein